MEGEDEEDICDDEKQITSRELKSLEVPAWMRPASASRSSCMSIVNQSPLQRLNMGMWMK